MRKRQTAGKLTLGAMIVFGSLACAGGPHPARYDLDRSQTWVVIDNTNPVIGSATIRIYPENGGQRVLGTVTINKEQAFKILNVSLHPRYRLVAENGLELVVSRPFSLLEGDVVVWDVSHNLISLQAESDASMVPTGVPNPERGSTKTT